MKQTKSEIQLAEMARANAEALDALIIQLSELVATVNTVLRQRPVASPPAGEAETREDPVSAGSGREHCNDATTSTPRPPWIRLPPK